MKYTRKQLNALARRMRTAPDAEWDMADCYTLCDAAGMYDECWQADGTLAFDGVIFKAARKLHLVVL